MSFSDEILPELPKNSVHGPEIEWGNTLVSEDTCSFIFTIQNYSLLNKENKESIESPRFSMKKNKDLKWFLELYPNGDSDENADYMSLFLRKEFKTKLSIKADYIVILISSSNHHNVEMKDNKIFKDHGWGRKKFIKNDILFDKKMGFLPNDTITIFCSVIAGIDIASETKSVKIISEEPLKNNQLKLSSLGIPDFYEKLYTDDMFTDITLIVDNEELKAHKCLLATASPVFASFFKTETNSIIVTDISYEVMDEILHYIYTKNVENLHNLAHELLPAANKYGILDLKIKCEESLCQNINKDNVLKLIVLADENDANELKISAIKFLSNNKNIMNSNPDFEQTFDMRPHLYKLILWSELKPEALPEA